MTHLQISGQQPHAHVANQPTKHIRKTSQAFGRNGGYFVSANELLILSTPAIHFRVVGGTCHSEYYGVPYHSVVTPLTMSVYVYEYTIRYM